MLFRALFCWVLSLFILTTDESSSYDTRFKIRGSKEGDPRIILVQIDANDLSRVHPLLKNQRDYQNLPKFDLIENSDAIFWDKKLWKELLDRILEGRPRKIAVTLTFDEKIKDNFLSDKEKATFKNPRLLWAAVPDQFEELRKMAFGLQDRSNMGSIEIHRDDDGVFRRIPQRQHNSPHLAELLVDKKFPSSASLPINFRSFPEDMKSYSLTQVLDPAFSLTLFENAFVIVGTKVGKDSKLATPLGPMSRGEILSLMSDNLLNDRWIQKFPMFFYLLGLLILVLFATSIITRYPQTVSFIAFIWIGTLAAALSAWSFDTFYIWMPALTPLLTLLVLWIVFIGYQATKIERQHFELKQEQKALRELEQLKNNFVSLISHDLKTPLAKIEAIAQRLLTHPRATEFRTDLDALTESSAELNHYIQSVLRLLRVESRDFRIHLESSEINEIIEEALVQVAPLARNKRIRLEKDLEPMFLAEFDPVLIKEVVVNLLDNAIKYTEPDGRVLICSKEISDDIESYIQVTVQDSGVGIPIHEVDNVWLKFVRGRDQEMKTKGTGLGLYLVKYFVELHRGQVGIESRLGVGTQVSFTLPLNPAPASTNTSSREFELTQERSR